MVCRKHSSKETAFFRVIGSAHYVQIEVLNFQIESGTPT